MCALTTSPQVGGTISRGTTSIVSRSSTPYTALINGRRHTGQSIVVNGDGQVLVDGAVVLADTEDDKKIIYRDLRITVEGALTGYIKTTSGAVTVTGDCYGAVSSTSGNVDVRGNAGGRVRSTSGNINVGGSVAGDAHTVSGNVTAKKKNKPPTVPAAIMARPLGGGVHKK